MAAGKAIHDKVRNMRKVATITSKGQITVPKEVRKVLGVSKGDKVIFKRTNAGYTIAPLRSEDVFSKYRGIGNPGTTPGRKAVVRAVREIRESGEE